MSDPKVCVRCWDVLCPMIAWGDAPSWEGRVGTADWADDSRDIEVCNSNRIAEALERLAMMFGTGWKFTYTVPLAGAGTTPCTCGNAGQTTVPVNCPVHGVK